MLINIAMIAALGAACAGCSAPSSRAPLTADDPASPDAAAVAFIRPINVLAEGAAPLTGMKPAAMPVNAAPMAGMSATMAGMPGMSRASPDYGRISGLKMAQATSPGAGQAEAVGTVNTVDAAGHSVNVTHQPIRALGWPSMTMDFATGPSIDLGAVKPGDRIAFTLGAPDGDGSRRIVRIQPMPGSAGRPPGGKDHGAMPGMTMPDDPR